MAEIEQKESTESGFWSTALKVLMVPVAAISGFWATKVSTYNNAYTNAADQGLMWTPATDELRKFGAEVTDGFVKLVGKNKISDNIGVRVKGMQPIVDEMKHALKAGETYEITQKSVLHHARVDEIVEEHMNKIGLGTIGKQWKFLRRDQKQKAVMEGLAVAGIAVAGLGAVISRLEDKKHVTKLDEQKPEQGPSIQ